MKKTAFLLGAAVVALTAGSAAAADLAVKARPAPIVAPVFSWTGCYIGVHAGGGAVRSSYTDQFNNGAADWGNGGLAGGQIGCNYQTGVFVFGIEGEGYWSGMKAQQEFSIPADGEGFFSSVRNKYDYTVAGRFGVTYERAFIYGKAGWAWGKHDFAFTAQDCTSCNIYSEFGSATLNGPLFGVGVEYAFAPNWTVKGEYNYINYGLSPVNFAFIDCGGSCNGTFTNTFSAEKHIFKFGVNYLFNFGPAPVVAKY
jgi:outer membrane immunogenic protein